jgi:hypothetical protein
VQAAQREADPRVAGEDGEVEGAIEQARHRVVPMVFVCLCRKII